MPVCHSVFYNCHWPAVFMQAHSPHPFHKTGAVVSLVPQMYLFSIILARI